MQTEGEEGEVDSVRCAVDGDWYALYFSRAPAPRDDEKTNAPIPMTYKIASGIYGYRADFLPTIVKLPRAVDSVGLHSVHIESSCDPYLESS